MAHNPAPLTGVERYFKDDEFIITKTDTKGIITYCNETCLQIAGYEESEIVGHQHNILRHPDMPRCIFKLLWDTIQKGEEILAYVVNKCKNGDHYWVFAHVTPSYSNDGVINGYLSCRRTANLNALKVIKPLYKTLCAEENKHTSKKQGMEAGVKLLEKILAERKTSYNDFVLALAAS